MLTKIAAGLILSFLFVILPALGNRDVLLAPHLWIVVVFGVLASVLQPGYNPITIAGKARDRGTAAQIIWSVYAVQGASVLEAAYLRFPGSVDRDGIAGAALALAVAGLGLRTWAVMTLGRLFTMHIGVERDHRLLRTGPYAWVRHPSYLGAFLLFLATPVLLHAWLSVLGAVVILPLAFLRRIHHEERMLKQAFGAEYDAYCRTVKRFVPGIW